MGQIEVNFRPQTAIKGQVLADFIAEFTYSNAVEVTGMANSTKPTKAIVVREKEKSIHTKGDIELWTLYVDSASNDTRSRAVMMLISPKGHKIHSAIHFGFKASNNEAKYEALIMGLRHTRELQVRNVKIFSDSQLAVNQVNDIYLARGANMAYLDKAKEQLSLFSATSVEVIPRSKNSNTDALAKLASTRDADLLDAISIEFLAEPNIHPQQGIMELIQESSWRNPIVVYLKIDEQPEDKMKARILWLKVARYVLYDDKLYRRGYSMPLLKCATPQKQNTSERDS